MKRLNKAALALVAAGLLSNGVAQAALFDRGGGLIYDDVLKITWLSDANYANTSGYYSGGNMNWSVAKTWAANLSFHDSVRNVDYTDWRLPTAPNVPCTGYSCTDSEMGYMFYINLGASAGSSVNFGTNTANLALFTNLLHGYPTSYWFGTAYAPSPTGFAWTFRTDSGYQDANNQGSRFYAWAVRPGDVAAVPEPEAYALLLAGLGLLGVVAKRRRRLFAAS